MNKDLENAWAVQLIRQEKCDKLEEENKNLKEEIERFKQNAMQDMKEITELEIENKKLKDQIDKLILKIDQLEEENENLRKDLFHLTNNGKAK